MDFETIGAIICETIVDTSRSTAERDCRALVCPLRKGICIFCTAQRVGGSLAGELIYSRTAWPQHCSRVRRSARQAIAPKRADSWLTSVRAFRHEDEILGLLGAVGIPSKKERACFSRKMRYVTQFCLSFVFNDLRHNKSWYGGSDRRLFGTVQLQPLLWQLGTGSTSTVESKQYQLSGRSAAW
jgi:hypothetical protein